MQSKFLVQNPHNIPVTKTVDIDGEPTQVAIDGFEVQLLSEDGMSGTLVLRYYGAAAKEARGLFIADAIMSSDWSVVSTPQPQVGGETAEAPAV